MSRASHDTPSHLALDALLDLARTLPGARPISTDEVLGAFDDETRAGCTDEILLDVATRLRLELRPVHLEHGQVRTFLEDTGPALLRPIGSEELVAITRGGQTWCHLVSQGSRRRLRTVELTDQLCAPARRQALGNDTATPPASKGLAAAHQALALEHLRDRPAVEGWTVEATAGSSFLHQLRAAGVGSGVAASLLWQALASLLFVGSWWLIGYGALGGHLDRGWQWGWALLLLTTVPLRAAEALTRSNAAWTAAALLKRRLLAGASRLDPGTLRGRGVGSLLGRVVDSEHIEALAINGGFAALRGLLELCLAAFVLAAGAAAGSHLLLLGTWSVVLALIAGIEIDRRRTWTLRRIELTHRLVERLLGHRTRLAQEARESWHGAEDRELEAYADDSIVLDRWTPRLTVLVGRGWLLSALGALLPAALSGTLDPTPLAISLGGVLLAFGALRRSATSIAALGAAGIAWSNVEPLFTAAARPARSGSPRALHEAARGTGDAEDTLLEAESLRFRYSDRSADALRAVSVAIRRGERLLLEGPSGSGKSTLASVIAGMRQPTAGWIGLAGIDRATWGDAAWRRRIVHVPQFHDNYLFNGSLALNVLLGRRWPARAEDLAAARQVLVDLGLGALLDEMPAGLQQPVGDSGWQLSQGERQRVFLARALLQDPDLLIVDESLGGLDGATLEQVLTCLDQRTRALLVIAHP
ncbi:MAG: ABC transporter ATP-binding protein [Acidobacteriota bacterium]